MAHLLEKIEKHIKDKKVKEAFFTQVLSLSDWASTFIFLESSPSKDKAEWAELINRSIKNVISNMGKPENKKYENFISALKEIESRVTELQESSKSAKEANKQLIKEIKEMIEKG